MVNFLSSSVQVQKGLYTQWISERMIGGQDWTQILQQVASSVFEWFKVPTHIFLDNFHNFKIATTKKKEIAILMKKTRKPQIQNQKKKSQMNQKNPTTPNKSKATLYLPGTSFLNVWMFKFVTLEQWRSITLIYRMTNRINIVDFCETCSEHSLTLFLYNNYLSWFNKLVTCTAVYKMFKLMLQDNKLK